MSLFIYLFTVLHTNLMQIVATIRDIKKYKLKPIANGANSNLLSTSQLNFYTKATKKTILSKWLDTFRLKRN